MRTLMSILALALTLGAAIPAHAAERAAVENAHAAQQVHALGKRPYQPAVVAKADADQAWVGATLRVEQDNQPSAFKLHQLGKRAL